ncbi:MAG: baseplate J/gp47 family protein [Methylocella sp.]
MPLNLKPFAALVEDQAAAIQARATALIDFTIGSILRAVIEAVAAIALWLEGEIVYALSLTRAATSEGPDLESWMGDYGVTKLASSFAAGGVTFSRFSADVAGLVPVGTVVRTIDGSQSFTVIRDVHNAAYDSNLDGYVMPIGNTSIAVLVKANVPGPSANVASGTVGLISSATPGIDTVTNVAAMSGGSVSETDPALRARFVTYIASLSDGTAIAIGFAVDSLQLGMQHTITRDEDYAGNTIYGFFYVVVDDGTGAPPQSLIDAAAAAIEETRAVGVRYGVFPPVILYAVVSFGIKVVKGYDDNIIVGVAGNAVSAYINTIPIGVSLPYSRIAQVAYDASPGISNVENLLLDGTTMDRQATNKNVIKTTSVSVSVIP